MNLHDLKATREALRKQLHCYDLITPACNNCEKLGSDKRCSHFAAPPPQDWLTGPVECEHWEYDGIPF